MALPLEKLGPTYPPRPALIDPDRVRLYAATTNDPNPAYEARKPGSEPADEAGASRAPTVEGAGAYAFEASSQGAVVVKNGLAEVV